ncbi:MAG TPA: hypothetical protein VGS80_18030, partial [Ktedonobacterales bacterium]|nr:hypothetical protein [Ktedonobacterales bacterium]
MTASGDSPGYLAPGYAAATSRPAPSDAPTTPSLPAVTPRPRTWPALLTLFFLSPAVAEMLSGSTPPLTFINPVNLLAEGSLYGCGAIVVRELVRRRGLGWSSILLLGAAYGILEEGLVVTSWFNPYWPDVVSLHGYSRALGTNWFWAASLTIYHAVVSITVPIILVEALFPRIAERPWLGRRGMWGFAIWLGVTSVLELIGFGFLAFEKQGYTHPPAMYFGALALAVALLVIGLRLKPPRAVPTARTAPGLWRLRLAGLAAIVVFFLISWALGPAIRFWPASIALLLGLVAFAGWRVRLWASRAGWWAEHRLALAVGVLSFFILLSPLLEAGASKAGKNANGMTLVALAWLVGLIWLS